MLAMSHDEVWLIAAVVILVVLLALWWFSTKQENFDSAAMNSPMVISGKAACRQRCYNLPNQNQVRKRCAKRFPFNEAKLKTALAFDPTYSVERLNFLNQINCISQPVDNCVKQCEKY